MLGTHNHSKWVHNARDVRHKEGKCLTQGSRDSKTSHQRGQNAVISKHFLFISPRFTQKSSEYIERYVIQLHTGNVYDIQQSLNKDVNVIM